MDIYKTRSAIHTKSKIAFNNLIKLNLGFIKLTKQTWFETWYQDMKCICWFLTQNLILILMGWFTSKVCLSPTFPTVEKALDLFWYLVAVDISSQKFISLSLSLSNVLSLIEMILWESLSSSPCCCLEKMLFADVCDVYLSDFLFWRICTVVSIPDLYA